MGTAASLNAPHHTMPWTKRPARNTVSGKNGELSRATKKHSLTRTERNIPPVLMARVTLFWSANGTNLAVAQLPSHTTQLRNTHATVLSLVITAVAVVSATQALVSANASVVSQVLLVKRLLIFSKYIYTYT